MLDNTKGIHGMVQVPNNVPYAPVYVKTNVHHIVSDSI